MRLSKQFKKVAKYTAISLAVVLVGGYSIAVAVYNSNHPQGSSPTKSITKAPAYTREELLAETNKHRKMPLKLDSVLNDTAQEKCEGMAAKNEFEHGDLQDIADQIHRRISENITYGPAPTAEAVVWNWINSPPHRAALVSEEWTRVGFGICPFRGDKLVIQHFSGEPSVQGASNPLKSVRTPTRRVLSVHYL